MTRADIGALIFIAACIYVIYRLVKKHRNDRDEDNYW